MKNVISLLKRVVLLGTFLGFVELAWGGNYYIQVQVDPNPSGAGTVYVGNSNSDPGESSYKTSDDAQQNKEEETRTFYLYTAPVNDLNVFSKWVIASETNKASTATVLNNATSAKGASLVVTNNGSRNNQKLTIEAKYNQYCRLYANSSPTSGGYVYVTDYTHQQTEAQVKSKGLTYDYAERTAKTIFTASAAPETGYHFKGWAESSSSYSTLVSTTQLNSEFEIDVLNSRTVYAMFRPFWQFSATAVATVGGTVSSAGGTATASVNTSEIEGEPTNNKASTLATFTATPADGYGFSGWATSAGTTTIPEGHYANPYTETITNEAKGTEKNLTLYAVFHELVNPTGMSVSPTSIELSKGVTKQITVTLTPDKCYKNITFVSSNPSSATVDANGVVTGVKSGTSTITVTSKNKNGTTAFTKTVAVKVMEQIPAPVVTLEPSASDNYDKAVVTVTAGAGSPSGVVFHYTTNGSDPTETSPTYSVPFKIANLETVKVRAYCPDWYESVIVEETYSKRIVSTPTIEINLSGSEYVVSFTCPDDDVVFYYTKDGSTPTYNKSTGAATGTTTKWNGTAFNPGIVEGVITVIATHTDWRDSDPVSRNYVRASGVSGGVVYLNDYEDHTWTYYAGVDTKVDGGNYNTNYAGILYSPDPRNVKITYQGNGGAVSIDNSETSFVYYCTLEKQSGKWLYTTIANPFSKRPTVGSGDSRWRGFGSWEVVSVSGGSIKSSDGGTTYGVGSQIPAETEIQFVPSGTYTLNCTSMNVVLKVNWVQAYRYTSASSSMSGSTYETNFVVAASGSVSVSSSSKPCTVMAVEPDGSTDYRSGGSCSSISSLSSGIVKMEYIKFTGSSISPAGKSLYVGRGVTTSNSPTLTGCNTNTTVNQLFKVESGTYSKFYCYTTQVSGSNIQKMVVVLGNDYDRATGTNTNLSITGTCHMENCDAISKTTDGDIFKVYIKSGRINSDVTHTTAKESGNCFYLWDNSGGGKGTRSLEIQGGELWNICGGADDENYDDNRVTLSYRMKGGTVHGCFYGGAASFESYGSKKFVLTGGTVEGWIAGGSDAYASSSGGGIVYGKSYIYIGGNLRVDSKGSTTPVDAGLGGTVFGAGIGKSSSLDGTIGRVDAGTNVVVADNSYVERGVYGGGSYGYTSSASYMYVTGGHVEGKIGGVDGTDYDSSVTGGIYGGACKNKGGAVNVYMTGGTVEGGIYGGSNVNGTVSSVNMVIAGGQVGTKTNLTAKACGGGYGTSTGVSGNVTMTLGVAGTTTSPYFYGNCYGGSALGTVTGNVSMTINKGGSYSGGSDAGGEIYCGGLGQSGNTSYGNVGGSLTTVINGTDARPGEGEYAYNAVYGGSHYINQSKTPSVTVNGCEVSIKELYGGSKLATLSGTNITVNGGNTIGSVYGGSNAANINGNVTLKVNGGGVDRVFGGNNNSGTISGTINMTIDQNSSCEMRLGEVYGGGNKAASNSVAINIGCPGYIGQLYGGANEANITGNIVLDVHGGTYGTIYGGNNKSGTISGSVTVNASKNSTCDLNIGTIFGGGNVADLAQSANKVTVNVSGDGTKVGNIYGGGNLASVYSTQVNVSGGQISGNVFGGGKGEKGSSKNMILSGGTNVNITGGTLTNVFGGNDAGGTITGTLSTKIEKNTAKLDIEGEVYGGGNEAASASGALDIVCVDHIGSVYGGAKNANITGNIALSIKSGKIDNVFGGNNLGGTISGTISIDVQHAGCSSINIGNLYGGGNLADYSAPSGSLNYPVINLKTCGKSPVDWVNSGLHCLKVGNIFGGGKGEAGNDKGKVTGNPHINIYAGEIGTVYGGGNAADVVGDTYVKVLDEATTDNQDIYITGNVYGGGNEASVTGATHVQIGPKP